MSQGPDGEVLNIGGQRGIFNNVSVDGADFNNPFFGEQRGGQRPAFTFNQDAIEEIVVVSQGASAEFGRSAGGFVNVITKSGTNEFTGSAHYFGQWDAISTAYSSERGGGKPEFGRGQFGFTLGGPIVRDRAFFFVAYDQQEASETKQFTRNVVNRSELEKLENFLQTQWPGRFDDEFGPIRRTDDNRALVAKLDFNLSDRHQASFKYNFTWSQQVNRDVRRGFLGSQRQRPRGGLLPRDQREPQVAALRTPSPTSSVSSTRARTVPGDTTDP